VEGVVAERPDDEAGPARVEADDLDPRHVEQLRELARERREDLGWCGSMRDRRHNPPQSPLLVGEKARISNHHTSIVHYGARVSGDAPACPCRSGGLLR
jgi:hypothetical protein